MDSDWVGRSCWGENKKDRTKMVIARKVFGAQVNWAFQWRDQIDSPSRSGLLFGPAAIFFSPCGQMRSLKIRDVSGPLSLAPILYMGTICPLPTLIMHHFTGVISRKTLQGERVDFPLPLYGTTNQHNSSNERGWTLNEQGNISGSKHISYKPYFYSFSFLENYI